MSAKNPKLATSPKQKKCKDCVKEGMVVVTRAAIYPGPRCYTHHHAEKKRRSLASHGRKTEQTYGITAEEYWKLYQAQGGRCAICRKAKGAKRRLAVDHDHITGVVRGLLCSPCNYDLLGRYDEDALSRAIVYRRSPPAFAVIGRRVVPTTSFTSPDTEVL